MGKGDKKTKRGKIFMGSTGVTRQKKKVNIAPIEAKEKKVKSIDAETEEAPKKAAVKKAAPKKAAAKKVAAPKAEQTDATE